MGKHQTWQVEVIYWCSPFIAKLMFSIHCKVSVGMMMPSCTWYRNSNKITWVSIQHFLLHHSFYVWSRLTEHMRSQSARWHERQSVYPSSVFPQCCKEWEKSVALLLPQTIQHQHTPLLLSMTSRGISLALFVASVLAPSLEKYCWISFLLILFLTVSSNRNVLELLLCNSGQMKLHWI